MASSAHAGLFEQADGGTIFFMRSASCRYRCKRSYCGPYRKVRSRGWAPSRSA
ncbi:hypothetical protein ACO0LM_23420 [Undibacterium sp. Di26W]|uniref:hypothetical protein n=1 Tax=Undibacterium sp. Di26W TaxID=3413035 RepID=UPI003BEFFB42